MILPKPRVTIFDVDGTLCDTRSLRHLVVGPHKDFDAFHRASAGAQPNTPVVDALRAVRAAGELAFVLTARDGRWADLTLDWLARHDINFDGFCHRPAGDPRPDQVVKAEILDYLSRHHDIIGAYDDRPRVIRMWHASGIPVRIVSGWHDAGYGPVTISRPYGPSEPLPAAYTLDQETK